jgi:catechol 2,3-dioxygenase-like lactoylglutathione lyase family enzyme
MAGLNIYMVGVVASDLERSAEFYRRLGVDVPDDVAGKRHVEVRMGELTFFLTTPDGNAAWDPRRQDPAGDGYRMILEFYLEHPDALDAKVSELAWYGYTVSTEPYWVTPQLRFALVDDPDGNRVLLSAYTEGAKPGGPVSL